MKKPKLPLNARHGNMPSVSKKKKLPLQNKEKQRTVILNKRIGGTDSGEPPENVVLTVTDNDTGVVVDNTDPSNPVIGFDPVEAGVITSLISGSAELIINLTNPQIPELSLTGLALEDHEHLEEDITDLDKYTKQEVDDKDSAIQLDLDNHKIDYDNPHRVDLDQVGGAPKEHDHIEEDIIDLDKYTKQEVDDKFSNHIPNDHDHLEEDITNLDKYNKLDVDTKDAAIQANLDAHKLDKNNPHEVTFDQVGGAPLLHEHVEADITDLDKYTKAEVDAKDLVIQTDLNDHKAALDNPHDVTLEQVGGSPLEHDHLEEDILDLDKYTQEEVDTKDALIIASLTDHINDTLNPHQVTAKQIGAALEIHTHKEVDITDLDKYDQATVDNKDAVIQSDLNTHKADKNNPHEVTAAQVGAPTNEDLNDHLTDYNNPHQVDYLQTGAEQANPNIQQHIARTDNPHQTPIFDGSSLPQGSLVPDTTGVNDFNFLRDDGTWGKPAVSPVGGLFMNYKWESAVDGTVSAGDVAANNADHTIATEIYIHYLTRNGNDASIIMDNIARNEFFGVWEEVGDKEGIYYSVTGDVTRNGDIYTIPVTWVPSATAIGGMDNNRNCKVFLIESPFNKLPLDGGIEEVLAKDTAGDYDVSWQSRMNWKGIWTSTTYYKGNVVYDAGFTMIANKETNDTAAPQPQGDPIFSLPELPAWDTPYPIEAGAVYSGNEFTLTQAGWISNIEIWVPDVSSNLSLRIILINYSDPDNPVIQTLQDPIVDEDGWTTVAVDPTAFPAGSVLAVILDVYQSTGGDPVSGSWERQSNSNNGQPNDGHWRTRNNNAELRISKIDNNGIDRSSDLSTIGPSSTFRIVQNDADDKWYEYQSTSVATDLGNSYEWQVTLEATGPGGQPDEDKLCNITIDVPTFVASEFVEATDYWLNNPPTWCTARGLLRLSGVDQNVPNNAYGTRINFQPAYISPDWEMVSYAGGAGGSGNGGGGGIPDAPSDTTFYGRKDALWVNPVIEDIIGLRSELDGKAGSVHQHLEAHITDLDKYTKVEVNNLLSAYVRTVGDTMDGVLAFDGNLVGTQYLSDNGYYHNMYGFDETITISYLDGVGGTGNALILNSALGTGTLYNNKIATEPWALGTFSLLSHGHDISDITGPIDADTLDGKHLASTAYNVPPFDAIPYCSAVGSMEIGRYLDFHFDQTATNYNARILVEANNDLQINANNVIIDSVSIRGQADGTSDLGTPTIKWNNLYANYGVFTNNITIGGNEVWHSGNDGKGSGLDADLLDGLDSSDFVLGNDVNNGRVDIAVNDADFVVTDNTDSISHFIWRDWSEGKLKLGTSNAVIAPRSHAIPEVDISYDLGSSIKQWRDVYSQGGNFSSYLKVNGYNVWHENNDGEGSGLNADTIAVNDTRSITLKPNDYPDRRVRIDFNNKANATGEVWDSIINVAGWAHDNYQVWQLAGPSSTGDSEKLMFRTGKGDVWNEWHEILHTGNFNSGDYLPIDGSKSLTGNLNIDKASPHIFLKADEGNNRGVYFQTQDSHRWAILGNGDDETGSNAGCNFLIARYDDNGNWLSNPIKINRDNGAIVTSSSVSPITDGTYNLGNSLNRWANVYCDKYFTNSTSDRGKISVWNNMTYSIGMGNDYTFGALNDFAMTFQMSDTAARGWWWGDTAHTNAKGSMSLTTNGELVVADSFRVGYGNSDTSAPQATLDVKGTALLNDKPLATEEYVDNAIISTGGATVLDVPPSDPVQGQLWFNSSIGELFVWYEDSTSGQWVSTLPVGSSSGVVTPPPTGPTPLIRFLWNGNTDDEQGYVITQEIIGISYGNDEDGNHIICNGSSSIIRYSPDLTHPVSLHFTIKPDVGAEGVVLTWGASYMIFLQDGYIVAQSESTADMTTQSNNPFVAGQAVTITMTVVNNNTPPLLYINGVLQGDVRFDDYWTTDAFVVGARSTGSYSRYYDGKIYETMLYDRVLSQSEIDQIIAGS